MFKEKCCFCNCDGKGLNYCGKFVCKSCITTMAEKLAVFMVMEESNKKENNKEEK